MSYGFFGILFFCRWLENAQLYLYDCVILGIGLNWIGFVGSNNLTNGEINNPDLSKCW